MAAVSVFVLLAPVHSAVLLCHPTVFVLETHFQHGGGMFVHVYMFVRPEQALFPGRYPQVAERTRVPEETYGGGKNNRGKKSEDIYLVERALVYSLREQQIFNLHPDTSKITNDCDINTLDVWMLKGSCQGSGPSPN